ncbi:uncharacterized protein LOC117182915 [Belonocnema kinseyi]|uniref:uncharacterized protein LOC117182915 n=1 Tax=Belonocnema kinseyi TaxID=2817044 RepID=UPI00143D4A84|nr:uncharacterized protein LOC117182915 [Belonocnema kinseyi]
MANLPSSRVISERPFYTSEVEYAGPYYLKGRPRSRIKIKAYMCIFVCFTTKAVHIELAHDLSTDAFLNCMRHFISRRGLCKHIHSDNGTTFLGARNALNELRALLSDSEFQSNVYDFLANQQIPWHLIPSSVPHFGGLWEAAVKSAKKHVYHVVGETSLTYEELKL